MNWMNKHALSASRQTTTSRTNPNTLQVITLLIILLSPLHHRNFHNCKQTTGLRSSLTMRQEPLHMVEMTQLMANFAQNEPIFDNELLYPSPHASDITCFDDHNTLTEATIESLVTYLTSPEIIDYQFMVDFFLSFRKFIDPLPLLELLLCRFTWCLKRTHSEDPELATTGKLALVRTFVTLRHWLLNHFQDDFIKDLQVRDLFASTINELPNHKCFITSDKDLQAQVVVNLKKSYLVLCHIYWNTPSLDKLLLNEDILHYPITSYESMPQSRLSVMGLKQLRDPSYRRSGIVSMVEGQSNKVQSSDRCILQPKASLISLGQNNLKSINREGTLENIYSNMLQHVKSTPIQGVKDLVPPAGADDVGFTIHGQIEVFQDSDVTHIAPGTPLKKLNNNVQVPPRHNSRALQERQVNQLSSKPRRLFFKNIFRHDIQEKQETETQPVAAKEEKLQITASSIDTKDKQDILSRRVIEEYHTMAGKMLAVNPGDTSSFHTTLEEPEIVQMSDDEPEDEDVPSSPTKRQEPSISSSQMLAQFNNKFDDTGTPQEGPSFGTPSVTMNWSNSLDISNTHDDIIDVDPMQNTEEHEQSVDISAISPVRPVVMKSMSLYDSTDQLNEPTEPARSLNNVLKDVTSEHSDEVSENSVEPIECSSMIGTEPLNLESRVSIRVISRNSAVSSRSYMTYDSDISSDAASMNQSGEFKLRKKNAMVDLRDVQDEVKSAPKETTDSYDLVCALKELPFYEEGFEEPDDDTVSMIPSPDQSCLLPYPGISQTAIDELAAIPDASIDCNPIEYARTKLNGKGEQSETETVNEDPDATRDETRSEASIEEMKLEQKVRDLFITNPEDPSSHQKTTKYSSRLLKNDLKRSSSFDMKSLSRTPSTTLEKDAPLVSVHEAMYKGSHIPFVLSYETDQLIQQMTSIERDILLEVDWKEFVDLKWDQPLEPYVSWLQVIMDAANKTSIQMVTLRFNLMTNWIISEILLCKKLDVRVMTLSRFIHLAIAAKKHQNYATMFQITLALTSPLVKKMRTTWSEISAGDLLVFKELKDLTSSANNFQAIRDEVDDVVPSKGIIPFMALHLSDLAINSERPDVVESAKSDPDEDDDDGYELVNFDKFRTACATLKTVLRQTEWAKLYDLKQETELLSKCLYVSSLSEQEMNYCFEHLEST